MDYTSGDFSSGGGDLSSGGIDFSGGSGFSSGAIDLSGGNNFSSGNDFSSGGNDPGPAPGDYNVALSLAGSGGGNDNSGGNGGGAANDAAPSYNFTLELPGMHKPLHNVASFLSHHSQHSSDHKTPPSSPPPHALVAQHTGMSMQMLQPQYTGLQGHVPMYTPLGSGMHQVQQQHYTVAPMSVQYTGQQQRPGAPLQSQPGLPPQPGMPLQQQGALFQPGLPVHPGMQGQPAMPGLPPQPFHPGMPGQPGMGQVQHQGVTIQQAQHTGITIPAQQTGVPMATPGMAPGVPQAALGSQYQQELFARCARGDHQIETKYGIVGIIFAIALFPIGLSCLFMDAERKCARCGYRAA